MKRRVVIAVALVVGVAVWVGFATATSDPVSPVLTSIQPCRLIDTRPAPNTVGPRSTPLGAGETYSLTVTGAEGNCTLPTDLTTLVMNVTVVSGTADSWLTIWPAGTSVPTASNLNWVAGQAPTPNQVTVGVSANGAVSFRNQAGTVHIVGDVVGYFTDHNHDDRYYTKAEIDELIDSSTSTTVDTMPSVPAVVHGDESLPLSDRPANYSAWDGDAGFPDGTGIWFLDRLSDGRLVIGSMTPTNSPEEQVVNTMVFGIYTPPTPGVPARFERVDVGRLVRPAGTAIWPLWSTIPVPDEPIGGGDVSDVCVVQQATADGQMAERVLALSAAPRKFLGEAATVGQYPGVVVIDPNAAKGTGPVDGRVDLVESETTSELAADAPPGAFPPSLSLSPVSQLTECDTSVANAVVVSQYSTPVTVGNPSTGVPPSNGNGAVMVLDPNGEEPNPATGDGRLTVPAALPLGQVTFVLDDGTADPPVVMMHPRDVKSCPCSTARTRFAVIYDGAYVDKATGQARGVHPLQLFRYDPDLGTIVPLTAPFVSEPGVEFNSADDFAEDGSLFVSRSTGLVARSTVVYYPSDIPAPDPSMTMAAGETVRIVTYPPNGPDAVGAEIPSSTWKIAADGWSDALTAAFSRSMTVVDDGDGDPNTSNILTVASNGVARVFRWNGVTRTAEAYCDRDLYGLTPAGTRWAPNTGVAGSAAIVRQGAFDPTTGLYEVPVNVFLTGTPEAVRLPMYVATVDARGMFAEWRVRPSATDTCTGIS